MARRLLLAITDLQIGGTPTVVRELAIRLHRIGIHVEVACLSAWGPVADQLREAGIPITPLGARRPTDLAAIARLIHLIRDRAIDTVLSFLIHANTAAALSSGFCPGVRYFQSIQTTQPTPRWHWWLQRLIHSVADAIIVPSRSVADAAATWSAIPRSRLVVIPNAIDMSDFAGMGHPAEDSRPFPIGFIGRLDPIKRIPDLLYAISRLEYPVHLHIFGEGSERPRIEQQLAALGLASRITLHGAIARPQDALAQVNLLVLPSAAEGFGLVLIEAMAAGVPVIATDVPGIRDVVIPDRTGLLVPPESPDLLARSIQQLIDDAPLRHRLVATAAADVAARFSWPPVLAQYRRVLDV